MEEECPSYEYIKVIFDFGEKKEITLVKLFILKDHKNISIYNFYKEYEIFFPTLDFITEIIEEGNKKGFKKMIIPENQANYTTNPLYFLYQSLECS